MFKKGQLRRNNLSGGLYLVTANSNESWTYLACVRGRYKGRSVKTATSIAEIRYSLIGNNYQERATEPARPGTAFKRWPGEMTSGIPEQRGCRKEDC